MKICPNCSAENGDDATFCMSCGFDLSKASGGTEVSLKDQAKRCTNCGADMAPEAIFCSKCGTKYEDPGDGGGKTMFFGAIQEKGQAKLVLVKGGGFEGASYNLNSTDHVCGRTDGFILFPDDPYVSPRHANFFYFGGKLFVTDEGSLNGVYIRIKSPVQANEGFFFLAGQQLFRVNFTSSLPPIDGLRFTEETEFLGSPSSLVPKYSLTHILEGGRVGSITYPEGEEFTIGRENCNLNFPDDGFMSGVHCSLTQSADKIFLTDKGSKNGTYYRIDQEQELSHDDFVFVGNQLLRVEIT